MGMKFMAIIAYLLAAITAGSVAYSQNTKALPDTVSQTSTGYTSSVPETADSVQSRLILEETKETQDSKMEDTTPSVNQTVQTASSKEVTASETAKESSGAPVTVNKNTASTCTPAVNCFQNVNSCASGSNTACTVNSQTCKNDFTVNNSNLADLMNKFRNDQNLCTVASNCPQNNGTNCTQGNSGTSSKTNNSTSSNTPSSAPAVSTPNSQTRTSFSAFQNKVVELVNAERKANGLKPLTINTQLTKTATLKSEDMAKLNYFDHTSPTYGSPFDMMKKYGISYRTAGENIAKGQTSPEQVMNGWMNSEGHRKNILNSSFTEIGVGIAKNAQGQYIWTQQFIG